MYTSPLCESVLARLERVRMNEHDRAQARAQIEKSAVVVDRVFGILEIAAARGRRLRRLLRIYIHQQKRKHAMAG